MSENRMQQLAMLAAYAENLTSKIESMHPLSPMFMLQDSRELKELNRSIKIAFRDCLDKAGITLDDAKEVV